MQTSKHAVQMLAESLSFLPSTELLQLPQAYLLNQKPHNGFSGKYVTDQGRSPEDVPSGRQETGPKASQDDVDQELLLLLTGPGKATAHMNRPPDAWVH